MTRVSVKPEMIRWARERAGLDTPALVERFPKYEAWERGEAQPTFKQLEQLARVTLTPFGYFFLPEPPEEKLPIPDFRTLQDKGVRKPSPNLLETIHAMQRRQEWMREYLIDAGAEPLPFIGSVTLKSSPVEAARQIRETLAITDGWADEHTSWTAALLGLRRLIEAAGILVMINGVVGNNNRRKLDPDDFRGFILCDKHAPLIFVNGSDFKSAQMFTLAHEVAHLWLGQEGVFNLPDLLPSSNEVERVCNQIAAEFLVPSRELQSHWRSLATHPEPFQAIARKFRVSPLVAARRALDLNLVSRDTFFAFLHEHAQDERRKQAAQKLKESGGNFYLTQEVRIGRRFGEAVVRAASSGKLLYLEAYRLTGLSGSTFDKFAEGIGLGALR
jgi:Zn-dependent peptidase ImmA (M78 family)